MRAGFVASNVAILTVIITVVAHNPQKHTASQALTLTPSSQNTAVANPLDQLSSADIALTVATMDSLPEATAIHNQADSQSTVLAMASTNDNLVRKPQVVATALKSKADIKTYVTVAGDTITSIAAKFGVTSDSIRWSNNLTGETIAAGTRLTIPPVNGIVYTVKAGDTADSLAQKFHANKDKIIAFNDGELNGLQPGEQIIVPDGSKAAAIVQSTRTLYSTGATGFAWGGSAIYGYNGYDYGYCTWYVANKRIALGRPLPANLGDAWTWDDRARLAGIPVDNNPRAGDAVVTDSYHAPGHVAYVEGVNPDGSVNVSEMNVVSWDVASTRTIPASQAHNYNYIH